MFSRRLQNIFKASLQDVFKIFSRLFLDIFLKTFSKRLQDVLQTRLEYVLKTSWRILGRQKFVELKTSSRRLQGVFNRSSPRRMFTGLILTNDKKGESKNIWQNCFLLVALYILTTVIRLTDVQILVYQINFRVYIYFFQKDSDKLNKKKPNFWKYSWINWFKKIIFFFFCLVIFHKHSQFTGQQWKWQDIVLTFLYHLHSLHRHLYISREINVESSPLRIASTQTQMENLWLLSASR